MAEMKTWLFHGTRVRRRVRGRNASTKLNQLLAEKLRELAAQAHLRDMPPEEQRRIRDELETRERLRARVQR